LAYIRVGHATFSRDFQSSHADVKGYGGFTRTIALSSAHAMHRSARSLLAERTPTFRQALENLAIARTYLIGDRSLSEYPEEDRPKHGVNVVILPQAGHLMNVDNPDGFARAIAETVAMVEASAAAG